MNWKEKVEKVEKRNKFEYSIKYWHILNTD